MASTTKSRALGDELRKARKAVRGLTVRGLAKQLGVSHASVSRWETGVKVPLPEEVATYLTQVGVSADLREKLIEMSRDADGSQWLSVGMPEQQLQLSALLEIERTALRITTVSTLLVPGLVQTSDYARAIMIGAGVPAAEIETRVAVRVGRREAITRKRNPTHLVAFIGEHVLWQNIGGPDVMADQLDALLEYSELPNVEIRVIPTCCEWHAGLEGPFSYHEFEGRGDVAHIENRVSGLFLQDDGVQAYKSSLPRVQEIAMSPADSAGLIRDARHQAQGRRREDGTG
jgi:transcriptional regulator with XRE-family HTH domain